MIIVWDWLFEKVIKGYAGITLFPFIFIHSSLKNDKVSILHERIHLKQQMKYLVVFFYIRYLFEKAVNRKRYGSESLAYLNISFEKEAYIKSEGEKSYNRRIARALLINATE